MKKIIYILMFVLTSINISASMMGHHMGPPHHKRHYMKEFHRDENITPEQQEKIIGLRMSYMKNEKEINMRLLEIRREMNHCMRIKEDEDVEKYQLLREEREELRRERRSLREKFEKKYIDILKKQ